MRIAWVSYDFGEYSINHAVEMARGNNVLLMIPENISRSYAVNLPPTLHYHPFIKPRLREPVRQFELALTLLRAIHHFKPDVVHFQRGHLWFNFALPLLRRYPLVITVHDPRHHLGDSGARNTPQSIMDFGYRRANRIIVHGHQLCRSLIDEIKIKPERIDVVPHIALGGSRLKGTVSRPERHILFFGRIWEYKGLRYLIRAAPIVEEAIPGTKIVIAGMGEDFAPYREMMTRPDMFEVYNEWVSDELSAGLFAQASIVVLPYVEATQSGVVPIAYTFGKPVVATRIGGLPDAVEHGVTGLLVPTRDAQALADAIIELQCNDQLRHSMGAAGRIKAQTELSPANIAGKTLEVYKKAILEFRRQGQ